MDSNMHFSVKPETNLSLYSNANVKQSAYYLYELAMSANCSRLLRYTGSLKPCETKKQGLAK
jgi:hypothetical protein